jgi:ribosomal protein S18 acetylase RimI-like enzyme
LSGSLLKIYFVIFRKGNIQDVTQLKDLALRSWIEFSPDLGTENWLALSQKLQDERIYCDLLKNADCIVCTDQSSKIIGMVFLISSGNPTKIFDAQWCYIRMLTVDPEYRGHRIGGELTSRCIEKARQNGERTIVLHTSEFMRSARCLYERIGFKVVKELEPCYGKRYWLYKFEL